MFVWSFTKWLGRVALWVLAPPIGLWRSIRHGRRQRDVAQADRIADAIARANRGGGADSGRS